MKLQKYTFDILKNMSKINSKIVIEQGSLLMSCSEDKTVLASAAVDDSFPKKIGIYDLGQFISTLSMFSLNDADITFFNEYVKIDDGVQKVKYQVTSEEFADMIGAKVPKFLLEKDFGEYYLLSLSEAQIKSIIYSSSTLGLGFVEFSSSGVKVFSDSNSNEYVIDVDTNINSAVKKIINVDRLKLYAGDYDVYIYVDDNVRLVRFYNKTVGDLDYYIATCVGK